MGRLREPKVILLLLFIVKLIVSAMVPLAPDETYYWVWGQNLQLSYFDHPPMISWLTYIAQFFDFGWGLIRLPTILLGTLTIYFWLELLKKDLPLEKRTIWLIFACASPFVGFGNSSLTPDVPLLFFWTLSILYLQKTLENKKTKDAFLLGLFLGLGFLAKYHIVLFIPTLLFYLAGERKWKDAKPINILIATVTGLVVTLPVLIWNSQNDWVSFLFQLNHGLGSTEWRPYWTGGFLLGQFILVFPPVIYFAAKTILRKNLPKNLNIHLYFSLFPLVFFLLTSFRGIVEMNWPVMAYPSLFVLAAFYLDTMKWALVKCALWASVILFIVIASLSHSELLPQKIKETHIYTGIASEVSDLSPVYASSYQMASQVWYDGKQPIYKLRDMSRFDFFDMKSESMPERTPFYVIRHSAQDLPEWVNERGHKWQVMRKLKGDLELIEVL